MKNELVVRKYSLADFNSDVTEIFGYLYGSACCIKEIYAPDVIRYSQILFDNAFLAFDFVLTIALELLSIAFLCVKVFFAWAYKSKVANGIKSFVRELAKATVEVYETASFSTALFLLNAVVYAPVIVREAAVKFSIALLFYLSKFKMELNTLWQFRKEIIMEDRYGKACC